MQPAESIASRLRRRDVDTFTELVRSHEDKLLRIANRVTGSIEDAEEVRQEVLQSVWQKPDRVPGDEHVGSWLCRCTVNVAIDRLRKSKRAGSKTLLTDAEAYVEQSDASFQDVDNRDLLEGVLAELTPEQRALLSLRFDLQLTLREIAAVLQRPRSTIQSQLDGAIALLRTRLKISAAGDHS
ncbi:MAG: RNA polymerase sigma factor [Aureliella sp.]